MDINKNSGKTSGVKWNQIDIANKMFAWISSPWYSIR